MFLNTSVGDATSFQWAFGDGGTATGGRASHSFANPGNYFVTLRVSCSGETDAVTRLVTVAANTVTTTTTTTTTTEPPPPPLEAGFIAAAGPPGSEQTISFNNITIGEADRFVWDFGDGTSAVSENPSHTYAAPGRYSVTITAFGPDGSDSATHPVQVRANS